MNEPAFEAASASTGPMPPAPPVAAARRSRWFARGLILLAVGLALVIGVALLLSTLHGAAPVHVSVDGHEVFRSLDTDTMPPAHRVVLAAVIAIALLSALVIVPIALLLGLVAVLGVVLLIVGLPMVAVLAALALLLSPLVLLGWLMWKLIAS